VIDRPLIWKEIRARMIILLRADCLLNQKLEPEEYENQIQVFHWMKGLDYIRHYIVLVQ
jgi:hypothetical protein